MPPTLTFPSVVLTYFDFCLFPHSLSIVFWGIHTYIYIFFPNLDPPTIWAKRKTMMLLKEMHVFLWKSLFRLRKSNGFANLTLKTADSPMNLHIWYQKQPTVQWFCISDAKKSRQSNDFAYLIPKRADSPMILHIWFQKVPTVQWFWQRICKITVLSAENSTKKTKKNKDYEKILPPHSHGFISL